MAFPPLIPSSRRFTPSQFPVTRHKFITGQKQSMLFATNAYKAELRLVYANRTPSEVALLMAHYDKQAGTHSSFEFPKNWAERVWGGWDKVRQDEKILAADGRWRYAAPPRITQQKGKVATAEIVLVQVPGTKNVRIKRADGLKDCGDGSGGSSGGGNGGGGGGGNPPGPFDPNDPSTWPVGGGTGDGNGALPDGGINWPNPVVNPNNGPLPPAGTYPKVPPPEYDPEGLGCWKPLSALCSWEPNGPGCEEYGCGGCVEKNCTWGEQWRIVGITAWYYQHHKFVINCPACRDYYNDGLVYSFVYRELIENADDTVTINYKTETKGPLFLFPESRTFWLETPLTCDYLGPRTITPIEWHCWAPPGYTRSNTFNYTKQFPERSICQGETSPILALNNKTPLEDIPYGVNLPDDPTVFGPAELGDIWDDGNLPWEGYPDLAERPDDEPEDPGVINKGAKCCFGAGPPITPGTPINPAPGAPEGPDGNGPGGFPGGGTGPNGPTPSPPPGPGDPLPPPPAGPECDVYLNPDCRGKPIPLDPNPPGAPSPDQGVKLYQVIANYSNIQVFSDRTQCSGCSNEFVPPAGTTYPDCTRRVIDLAWPSSKLFSYNVVDSANGVDASDISVQLDVAQFNRTCPSDSEEDWDMKVVSRAFYKGEEINSAVLEDGVAPISSYCSASANMFQYHALNRLVYKYTDGTELLVYQDPRWIEDDGYDGCSASRSFANAEPLSSSGGGGGATPGVFPRHTPSRRSMKYGEWNTKKSNPGKSNQAITLPLPKKSIKSEVILELVYANRADGVARDFMNHYLAAAGVWDDFKLPGEKLKEGPMAGWSVKNGDRYLSKGRWAYNRPPLVESVHPGTSTVTVQLISLESKAFAGPGAEIKPLDPCQCPPPYSPGAPPPQFPVGGPDGNGPNGSTPIPSPGPGDPDDVDPDYQPQPELPPGNYVSYWTREPVCYNVWSGTDYSGTPNYRCSDEVYGVSDPGPVPHTAHLCETTETNMSNYPCTIKTGSNGRSGDLAAWGILDADGNQIGNNNYFCLDLGSGGKGGGELHASTTGGTFCIEAGATQSYPPPYITQYRTAQQPYIYYPVAPPPRVTRKAPNKPEISEE